MPLQGIPSIIGAGIRSTSFAPFSAGFDFRATSGYVTDVAPNTYCLAADTYPTSRGGFTFGWDGTVGIDGRDRNAGVDVRLAGIVFGLNTATIFTWRLDLPAPGTYQITLALGDGNANPQKNYFGLQDTFTSLLSFSPVSTTGSTWADATGTLLNAAAWPGSNTPVSKVFATSILRITLSGTVDTDSSCIAYLGVVRTA